MVSDLVGRFDAADWDVRLTPHYVGWGIFRRRQVEMLRTIRFTDPRTGLTYPVVAGSRSDWATIPWPFMIFFPIFDGGAEAAITHDSLLKFRQALQNGLGVEISRAQIDRAYRHALRALGFPQWRFNLYWLAVRLGGIFSGDR